MGKDIKIRTKLSEGKEREDRLRQRVSVAKCFTLAKYFRLLRISFSMKQGRQKRTKFLLNLWLHAHRWTYTHTSSIWVCEKSVSLLVNDTQWMWWERNMARLQVCLLLIQWEWMRLTAIHSNNTPAWDTHWSSHQSFPQAVDGSILLQYCFLL